MTDTPTGPAVNPPPIGEALSAGWTAFKGQAALLIVAVLLINIAGIVPFLPLLMMPGMYLMSLKAVRNQKPEMGDLFVIFQDRFMDHLMILLLQICGVLLCCVGQFLTQPLFTPGSFLVLDRKMDWKAAKDECWNRVKPNLLAWFVFFLVMILVAMAGVLVCFVGVLITGPLVMCAWAYAYEKCWGGAAKPA